MCDPCYSGTGHQPRFVDLVRVSTYMEQPSTDERRGGMVEKNNHIYMCNKITINSNKLNNY